MFFSILFKNLGKRTKKIKLAEPSLPTVKPDQSLFECYEEIFNQDITSVSGISREEKKEIYSLISETKGGFLNMGDYFNPVYEKYFKGREWKWAEYEDWNAWFTSLGKFPTAFKIKTDYTVPETAIGLLTISELKSILSKNKITTSSKAKKRDLIALFQEHIDINSNAMISQAVDEKVEKEKHIIYRELMLTISSRAKSLHDYRRATSLGTTEFKIIQGFASDEEFSKIALEKTSRFLPPRYPFDHSCLSSITKF